jgi:hypothetical protein
LTIKRLCNFSAASSAADRVVYCAAIKSSVRVGSPVAHAHTIGVWARIDPPMARLDEGAVGSVHQLDTLNLSVPATHGVQEYRRRPLQTVHAFPAGATRTGWWGVVGLLSLGQASRTVTTGPGWLCCRLHVHAPCSAPQGGAHA